MLHISGLIAVAVLGPYAETAVAIRLDSQETPPALDLQAVANVGGDRIA
ncbi:hypothetical protein QE400_003541 [Xanthomonas sacchari]|nr:hypothetical protein [Xanthomonas sacchari]MDQ1094128.1 hypothetical protein [Xanthomonas sacchari]